MNTMHCFLEGGRISIKDHTGATFFPSALDVYTIIFSGTKEFHGQPLEKPLTSALPELIFSRFPAEPAIRISNVTPGSIVAKVGVWTDRGYCHLPDGYDQIIIDKKWYPINTKAIQSVRDWLISRGVNEENSLSFGKLIELRSTKDLPAKLIDESVIAASDVASNAGQGFDQIQGLNAQLYPYQVDGVGFLKVIAQQEIGCILADEMGLGKTLQVIALLLSERNIRSGKLTALAVASPTRSNFVPDVPTFEESGVKGYSADAWYGVMAPANLPESIQAKLQDSLIKNAKDPKTLERLSNLGLEAQSICANKFSSLIENEVTNNVKLAKQLNLKMD